MRQGPKLDAQLAGYLTSIPPEHQEELTAAVTMVMAAQRKGSWTRSLVVAAAALVGSGWTARSYLADLATKADISRLEAQYAAVGRDIAEREEKQNERLAHLEGAIRGMKVGP